MFFEHIELAVFGRVMNAKDAPHAVLDQTLRDRLVRDQHRLLDRAMRSRSFAGHDAAGSAIRIEFDLTLGNREVDRAFFEAQFPKTRFEFGQQVHLGDDSGLDSLRLCVFVFHDLRRLLIRKPRPRLDHCRINARTLHTSREIDVHLSNDDEPVDPFAQGAQVGGNSLGQHGHDAIREVHAVATPLRFAIECGAFAHIE